MRPPLPEQIKIIDKYIAENPKFESLLERHKQGLNLREHMEALPLKGSTMDIKKVVNELLEKVMADKTPLSHLLDPDNFSYDELVTYLEVLLNGFEELEKIGYEDYLAKVKDKSLPLTDLVEGSLKNDPVKFANLSRKHGIDMSLLFSTTNALLQPFMEELSREVPSDMLQKWEKAECPVCGREVTFGFLKDKKRHFKCNYCGTEYPVGLFTCNHCGRTDAGTMKFLSMGKELDYKIDFCTECKHYTKIVDTDKVRKKLPDGIEDIVTLELDYIAKNEGLVRPM